MSKIKDYFSGEKDERIRQGTTRLKPMRFEFYLSF